MGRSEPKFAVSLLPCRFTMKERWWRLLFPKTTLRIKDNNNSPHDKFHRFLFPFSSKFFRPKLRLICSLSFTRVMSRVTHSEPGLPMDELRNFPTKFGVKFTTSFWSSFFDWQLRNEIAKFVANFGNFKRTSETVCQKFCETHFKSNVKCEKENRQKPACLQEIFTDDYYFSGYFPWTSTMGWLIVFLCGRTLSRHVINLNQY